MKKNYLFILTFLLIIPITVFATENPKVLTLDADSDNLDIMYEGTMENNSYAVMCKLYDSNDEELDLLSLPVENNSFAGMFTAPSEGDYVVACANYEGGEIKKIDVTVTDDMPNPNTYDAGIKTSIIVLVISLLGILGITVFAFSKKRKKN